MATYQVNGNQSGVSSSLKGSGAIWSPASPLRRLKIYEFDVGATNVPAGSDTNITIDISRMTYTSLIAGASYTPNPTDPADGPAAGVALINITTELAGNSIAATPEYNNGMNQRNTIRWVAAQESQYLISPATVFNGHYMRLSSVNYTSSCQANVYYLE